MGPFSHRSSERHDQEMKSRMERDFQLRATFDDEESQRTLSSFDEQPGIKANQREEHTIRNLGFFKEQERQFTQTEDEEEWQERQSPINFVLIVSVFVILCVIGWFGYRWANQTHMSDPPIIAADPTPFKVRPENPGGMIIPHQDKLVYGRLSPDQIQPIEHLLPAPEQLITPPSQQPQPHTFVDANGQVYYAYPVPQTSLEPLPPQDYQDPTMLDPNGKYPQEYYNSAQPNSYPAQVPQSHMMAPLQPLAPVPSPQQQQQHQQLIPIQPYPLSSAPNVPTHPGLPQQHPSAMTTPPPQMVLRPPLQQQRVLPALPASQALSEPVRPPVAPSDKDALEQLIEQEMDTVHHPELKSDEAVIPLKDKKKGSAGTYKLQVATLDSKAAAEKEAKRIRNIDPRLFSDKKLLTQEISSMGTKKPSYRVVIEGFSTPNAAAQFSNKLKTHKVKGIVLHQPT